jgi:uncharacterized Ntn-hydrolase superfamily protein
MTYSIVARDPETGEMGVAVQSHYFSVGSIVGWAEAGVGAVATQALVNTSLGPLGLARMRAGESPFQAMDALLDADGGQVYRQVAFLNAAGEVATYTGAKCIAEAGHLTGDGFSVQANMMLNVTVWPAMAAAFNTASGPLAERLIMALAAAQDAGGDVRGQQSASLLVVRGEPTDKPWNDRLIDLRVEDHVRPVAELKRLLRLHRAYSHMDAGEVATEKGDAARAMQEYGAAGAMFPDNIEMKFWHAVALANLGRIDEALPLFKSVFVQDPNWRTLAARLPVTGVLDVSNDDLKAILVQR